MRLLRLFARIAGLLMWGRRPDVIQKPRDSCKKLASKAHAWEDDFAAFCTNRWAFDGLLRQDDFCIDVIQKPSAKAASPYAGASRPFARIAGLAVRFS